MIYSEHKFTLDISAAASLVSLAVKKGETGRRLRIHLTEGGYPYHFPEGCYAVFSATKPDGNKIYNGCLIESCEIVYDMTAQTVSAAGLMECAIHLYGADGGLLISGNFHIVVYAPPVDQGDIESAPEYSALEELIAKLNDVQGNYYDLDLTAIVTANHEATSHIYDVSSAVDGDELMRAVRAGQIVRVHYLDTVFSKYVVSVPLTDAYKPETMTGEGYLANLGGVFFSLWYKRYGYIYLNVRRVDGIYEIKLHYHPDPGGAVEANGSDGADGEDGSAGGYYTPIFSQPTDDTMQIALRASNASMPAVAPVVVDLPAGPAGGDGYTPAKGVDYYTNEDKAEMVGAVMGELPVTADADGYTVITGQRGVVGVSFARVAGAVNLSIAQEGNKTITGVMILDEDDRPTRIVVGDAELAISWEGF